MSNTIPFSVDQKPAAPITGLKCPNMVAVASGKGGVGKTMIAASLCHVLAQEGKKVLLFDGDIGLANVDIQLGLTPEKDLADVIAGEMSLQDAVINYKEGQFDILAGRSGSGSLATLPFSKVTELRSCLITLAASYDYIVVDLGAGVDKAVRHMAGPAAAIYVVITDEPTSLTDGYAFIKLARAANPSAEIRIVVNMAKDQHDGKKSFETIARACSRFINYTPTLAGVIRRDPKVRESIRAQTPVLIRHPSSDAAQDLRELAKTITTVS